MNVGFLQGRLAARRAAGWVACSMLGLALAGCGSSAPAAVEQSFARLYPGLDAVWTAQPYGYEGIITINEIEYEAEFAADGTWLETEVELAAPAFPPAVMEAVRREYPGHDITKYEIELTPDGSFYELEIQGGGTEREIYYDGAGQPAQNSNEDA